MFTGERLLAKKHKASREIRAQLESLLNAWHNLLQESNNRGRGLEEAQDILEFNNQVEKIEAWIRDKVSNCWGEIICNCVPVINLYNLLTTEN